MSGREPPEGYAPHFRKSGLTDPWEPLYSRTDGDGVSIGLWADEAHVNSRGFVHGGLMAALADNALGLSCAVRLERVGGLVTVSLGVDYLASAQRGQWVATQTTFVRTGGTLCFASGFVLADGQPCARVNATFRVLAG